MAKRFLGLLVYGLCIANQGLTQTLWENKVYKPSIRSVQFSGLDQRDNYPILQLGTNQTLWLEFDDLDGELKDFQYTIVHCDFNWNESQLMQNEYIQGVFSEYILDNETSFNTYISYTHYKAEVPNMNIRPKLSGNYILKVFEDGDEENIVLTRRFFVFQRGATVRPSVQRPTYSKYYDQGQEVDVMVSTGGLTVLNEATDYKIALLQNGRFDNAVTHLTPRFFRDKELDYNYEDDNVFDGFNEWRFFDTRNVRFGGQNINKVYQDSYAVYNALLYPDKDRSVQGYTNYADFNGYTLIEAGDVDDEDVEGDYVWVHFKLLSNGESDGEVYVYGACTDWRIDDRFKLSYNKERLWYEGKVLLKQGYYNYTYATVKNSEVTFKEFDGSFYQTENDYQIFFYQYSMDLNCDLLVGYQTINSVKGIPTE